MSVPASLPFTLQNGQPADATQVMANYNALVAAFGSAAAAGVNSDITQLNGITTPLNPTFGGTQTFVATANSTGSANVQIVSTTTPTGFVLTRGYTIVFVAGFTNTGATTLQVGLSAATNVLRASPAGPQVLTGGEIIAGNVTVASFDGTQFQLVTVQSAFGGFGSFVNINAAATTELGSAPSHHVQIVGSATISSFGTLASPVFPLYTLRWAGICTLVNNPSTFLLPGNVNIVTAVGDTAFAMYYGNAWQIIAYQRLAAAPPASVVSSRQTFTAVGAGTYTTPTSPPPRQLFVRMVGGGGGGGGTSATGSAGSTGGATSFAGVAANPGVGAGAGTAASGGGGGAGGTSGAGAATLRLGGSGGQQGAAVNTTSGGQSVQGGVGGVSALGGGGATGGAAAANSGSGGGGVTMVLGAAGNGGGGGGGGAGEYVELIINSPAASYGFTVGGGGAAGTGAGAGGSGIIIVDERY